MDEIVNSAAAGSRMRRGPNRAFKNDAEDPAEHHRHVEDRGYPGGFIESQAERAAQVGQANAEKTGIHGRDGCAQKHTQNSDVGMLRTLRRRRGRRAWLTGGWHSRSPFRLSRHCRPPPFVWTIAITDSPGRNRLAIAWPGSNTIFTGIRCTIFVKLPVALSGGNNANCEPLAGDRLSTLPRENHSRKCIHADFGRVARVDVADLRFFDNWPAPKRRFEPAR